MGEELLVFSIHEPETKEIILKSICLNSIDQM